MSGGVICCYCQQPARLRSGATLFPHIKAIKHRKFWRCEPCDAHVGCHEAGAWMHDSSGKRVTSDGTLPLGSLANAELRKARSNAHREFDPLWKQGALTRRGAYEVLAKALKLRREDCHIAMFDLAQCEATIALAHKMAPKLLRPAAGSP